MAKQPGTAGTPSDESWTLSGGAGRIFSPRTVVGAFGLIFLANGFTNFVAGPDGSGLVSSVLLAVALLEMAVGAGLVLMLRWAYYGALLVMAVNLATAYLTISLVPLAVSIAAIGLLLSYSGADWQ